MARATCLPPQASPRPRACRSPPANRSQKRSRRAGRRRRGMLLPRRSAPRTGRSAASAGGSAPRLHAVWLTAALGCAAANLLCARPRRWQKRGFAELLRPLACKTIRQRLLCCDEAIEMPLPPVCLRHPPAQPPKSQRRSGVSAPSARQPALTACSVKKFFSPESEHFPCSCEGVAAPPRRAPASSTPTIQYVYNTIQLALHLYDGWRTGIPLNGLQTMWKIW